MYIITMPQGGQTTDESYICKWHKKPGDKIGRGDVLFEIETDKTTLEVESFCAGFLRAVKYGEGESAVAGEIVAYIGEMDEELPPGEPLAAAEPAEPETAGEPMPKAPKEPEPARLLASPLAKKIAAEHKLNLADIHPSLPSGVIKKRDVTAHIEKLSKKGPAAFCRSIGVEANAGPCALFLDRLNACLNKEKKVEFIDAALKCVFLAAEKFPSVKAMFEGDKAEAAIKNAGEKPLGQLAGLGDGFESGVIEIGPVKERAASQNRQIVSLDIAEISVHFDPREITKASVRQFLEEVRKLLESPELLILTMAF
ncbi:MAG: E3 binding domain-containing protein [Oscillospiraceae bacterium]|nr:E3 binding domain-containing protein [Oscillospiraceae bacterium]